LCLLLLFGYGCFFFTIWYLTQGYQSSSTIQEMRWVLTHLPDQNLYRSSWSQTLNHSSRLSALGNQVVPVILKMSNFTKKMEKKEEWKSSFFFTFHGGYQLYLRVNAAGYDDSHVSIHLHNVKGPYNDVLKQSSLWPLTGMFTIELLNQLKDTSHFTQNISITVELEDTSKDHIIWEASQFISHDKILKYHCLKNDNIFFRINFVHKRFPFNYNFHLMDHLAWSLLGGMLAALIFNGMDLIENTALGLMAILTIGCIVIGSLLGGMLWFWSILITKIFIYVLLHNCRVIRLYL